MNPRIDRLSRILPVAVLLGTFAAGAALTGCAPMIVAAGVGAGALVATDRRSAGAQVDDEAIELKMVNIASSRWPNDVHLNTTSYNGIVLLTGEAPTAAVKDEIARSAQGIERVRSVQNEMVVGPVTGLGARTNDTYITSKVKARFTEARKFAPTHVKVVTERNVVFLMGLVTRDEANAAAQIASSTTDVARVVKVFEYTN